MASLELDLKNAMEAEASASFAKIGTAIKELCPEARVSTSVSAGAESAEVTLSMLQDPSGDEVAVAVELAMREEVLWCELTLFVGQRTCLTMAWSGWSEEKPLAEQVARTTSEFLRFAEPRATAAFQSVIAADRDRATR